MRQLHATAVLAVLALLSGCSSLESGETSLFTDLDGTAWQPLDVEDDIAHVLVFVTTDCPIANSYAPEIRAIATDHGADHLRFFVVHVDPDVTVESAQQHARDYDLPRPILLDRKHQLAKRLGIRTTPEAAVLLANGDLAYRGRIDNLWGDLGRRRPRASRHDLRDALRAVLAGEQVPNSRTEAIGCDLPVL